MEIQEGIKGIIFNIQKFSIHDGFGIRTLIFMKGCPLQCIWCCNPESQAFGAELMFVKKNCIGCGKCAQVCPETCTDPQSFAVDRTRCIACGVCSKNCCANAKKVTGSVKTVYEVMCEIEKDRIFYRNSKGGVTIGGGEPTSQAEFVTKLLTECNRANLHTAIETCGFGQWERIESVFEHADQIFFDLKHMDDETHEKLTGVGNKLILENAAKASALGKDITFRIPLIPGCNDGEKNIQKTGLFIKGLQDENHRVKAEILPYHGLGADKYVWIGKSYGLPDAKSQGKEVKVHYNQILKDCGCNIIE